MLTGAGLHPTSRRGQPLCCSFHPTMQGTLQEPELRVYIKVLGISYLPAATACGSASTLASARSVVPLTPAEALKGFKA